MRIILYGQTYAVLNEASEIEKLKKLVEKFQYIQTFRKYSITNRQDVISCQRRRFIPTHFTVCLQLAR